MTLLDRVRAVAAERGELLELRVGVLAPAVASVGNVFAVGRTPALALAALERALRRGDVAPPAPVLRVVEGGRVVTD